MTNGYIGTLSAGVLAAVDPAADTEEEIMDVKFDKKETITKLTWTFANVVDAKAMSGYMEIKSDKRKGPWRFPIGYGAGGAATASARKRGELDVVIHANNNETFTMFVTMNEANVGFQGGFETENGHKGKETYMECNVVEDAALTANTREVTVLPTAQPIKILDGMGGTIKKIFVSLADVVNAKQAGGVVDLESKALQGVPSHYIFGGGSGGATNCQGMMNASEISGLNTPITHNSTILTYLKCKDAKVDAHVGIQWIKN